MIAWHDCRCSAALEFGQKMSVLENHLDNITFWNKEGVTYFISLQAFLWRHCARIYSKYKTHKHGGVSLYIWSWHKVRCSVTVSPPLSQCCTLIGPNYWLTGCRHSHWTTARQDFQRLKSKIFWRIFYIYQWSTFHIFKKLFWCL